MTELVFGIFRVYTHGTGLESWLPYLASGAEERNMKPLKMTATMIPLMVAIVRYCVRMKPSEPCRKHPIS